MSGAQDKQSGFTLMEVMVAAIVAIPILTGIVMTTNGVNGTITANVRAADVSAHTRRIVSVFGRMLRPARITTIRMAATAEDVAASRATELGEWIPPSDQWSRGIQFTSASGYLKMNASGDTGLNQITFEMDPKEKPNGVDDDGDGLVDEGSLHVVRGGVASHHRDVEDVAFLFQGRMVHMRLTIARRDSRRRVYRISSETQFYVRNH